MDWGETIDYIGIALQGFSTGVGVIAANEAWQWIKHHKDKVKEGTQKFVEESNIFNQKL